MQNFILVVNRISGQHDDIFPIASTIYCQTCLESEFAPFHRHNWKKTLYILVVLDFLDSWIHIKKKFILNKKKLLKPATAFAP